MIVSPVSVIFASIVSANHSQLQSKNIKQQIPETNNS